MYSPNSPSAESFSGRIPTLADTPSSLRDRRRVARGSTPVAPLHLDGEALDLDLDSAIDAAIDPDDGPTLLFDGEDTEPGAPLAELFEQLPAEPAAPVDPLSVRPTTPATPGVLRTRRTPEPPARIEPLAKPAIQPNRDTGHAQRFFGWLWVHASSLAVAGAVLLGGYIGWLQLGAPPALQVLAPVLIAAAFSTWFVLGLFGRFTVFPPLLCAAGMWAVIEHGVAQAPLAYGCVATFVLAGMIGVAKRVVAKPNS